MSERDLEAHEIEQGIGENFYSEVCVLFFHVHSDIKPDLRENTDELLWKKYQEISKSEKTLSEKFVKYVRSRFQVHPENSSWFIFTNLL